jgi:hypothetical protein
MLSVFTVYCSLELALTRLLTLYLAFNLFHHSDLSIYLQLHVVVH